MKKYYRVLSRLYDTPLAILPAKLAMITDNVTAMLREGGRVDRMDVGGGGGEGGDEYEPPEKVGLIKVFDSLVARNGVGDSGITTYASIQAECQEYINEGKTTLVFHIDSGGGEVKGLFALTDYISSIPKNHNVKTIAFSDGHVCSAAYAIGSACQTVYCTDTAVVGSIGVISTLQDWTEQDKIEGRKYIILRSQENKALYNPHEKVSNKVIDEATTVLAKLDDMLSTRISTYRPVLTKETIMSFKGDTFLGKDAVESELVDAIIQTLEEVVNIAAESTPKQSSIPSFTTTPLISTPKGAYMNLEQALQANAELQAQVTTLKNTMNVAVTEAAAAETARCLEIITAGNTLSIPQAVMVSAVKTKLPTENAVQMFTAIKESQDASLIINTTQAKGTLTESTAPPPQGTLDGSLLNGAISLDSLTAAFSGVGV